MTRKALGEALEKLEGILAESSDLEPERRERVDRALQEMHEAVEVEGGSHPPDSLMELATHFAEEHPRLSEALGRVADALAKLGI
ncbi:MAG: DUF4404 family protein [Myxococcota bacterium]|nr:DUF4404 family protein [Myxococcota bacterium]